MGALGFLFWMALAGCDDGPAGGDAGVDGGGARQCRPGTPWDPATPAFADRTDAWGLGGVDGSALAVRDLDGDGFPDLAVLDAENTERGLGRIFMSRPGAGGGRTFVDATEPSGFFATRDGAGGRITSLVAFGDLEGDGDADAFAAVYATAGTALVDYDEVLLNRGDGTFDLGPRVDTDELALPFAPRTGGLAFTDHDVDGVLDLLVVHWYAGGSIFIGQGPHLLRGDGAGGFTEASAAAGIVYRTDMASLAEGTNARPLFGATACDVSGDGRPDLLGAAYGRQWNQLWVSDGERYVERGRELGVAADGLADFTQDNTYHCFCAGGEVCRAGCPCAAGRAECPPGLPAPVFSCRDWCPGIDDQPFMLGGNTFSIACGDIDGDGDLDLVTGEIKHPDVATSDPSEVLVNRLESGTLGFDRPGRDAMGLVPPLGPRGDERIQNSALLDFDGDGRLDVYLGGSGPPPPSGDNPLRGWLYQQVDPAGPGPGDLRFRWIGAESGFHHPCAHGIAISDLDRDGDEDIVVGTYGCEPLHGGRRPVRVYENLAAEAQNFLSVRVVGRGPGGTNRDGIGVRVRVTAGGVTRTREIHGPFGRGGSSAEPVAHFGLGAACRVETLEIRWLDPAGSIETFTDLPAGTRLEVREGEGMVRTLP